MLLGPFGLMFMIYGFIFFRAAFLHTMLSGPSANREHGPSNVACKVWLIDKSGKWEARLRASGAEPRLQRYGFPVFASLKEGMVNLRDLLALEEITRPKILVFWQKRRKAIDIVLSRCREAPAEELSTPVDRKS